MTGDPLLLLGCALVACILLVPSLTVVVGGTRLHAGVALGGGLVAGLLWAALGWQPAIAALQGAVAAGALSVVAPVLASRLGRATLWLAVAALALLAVPLGVALFDLVDGAFAAGLGVLDFGQVGLVAIAPAVIGALVTRSTSALAPPVVRAAAPLGAAVGVVAVVAGLELVVDDRTVPMIVTVALGSGLGLVGWTGGLLFVRAAVSPVTMAPGALAGALVAAVAPAWLDAGAVMVLAVIAGILGRVAAQAVRADRAVFVGVLLVPALVGYIGAGVIARRVGLLVSGSPELVIAQLGGAAAIVTGGAAVAGVLLLATLRRRRG